MRTAQDIWRNLCAIEAFIAREADTSARSVTGRVSKFWCELFDQRPNFPDITAFLAFRRANFGYGMADERQGTLEEERLCAARTWEIFRQSVPAAIVAQVDEPVLGAPYVFEHEGLVRSSAFWINAATAHRVAHFALKGDLGGRPLDIVEIGAGWGCAAYQIHHLLNVRSYVVIDLPQNLLLSSAYLSGTLTNRKLTLLSCEGESINHLPDNTVLGLLPGAIPRLKGSFDIILNSFSLQEMDLDTVRSYMAWIKGVLGPAGLFISFNSHGKAGVRRPADYAYEQFTIHHLGMFRRYPSGFFNTIPYEIVLSAKSANGQVSSGPAIDTLCCLYQFGLGEDLAALAAGLTSCQLQQADVAWLDTAAGLFSTNSERRAKALNSPIMDRLPAVRNYLLGQHHLALGESTRALHCLTTCLERGLLGFARLRAEVMVAGLSGRRTLPPTDSAPVADRVYPEARRVIDTGDVSPFIRQFHKIVRLD